MDNFLALDVSYEDLESALLRLGFSLTISDLHRLYYHAEPESFFGFSRDIALQQRVRPAHLSSARHAVVAMGVANEETFRNLLAKLDSSAETFCHPNTNGHVPLRSHTHHSHTSVAPLTEAH